jgi:hypothetical protein
MTAQPETAPQLDKPGAGLPFLESLVVRWYFGAVVSKRGDWEDDKRKFDVTTAKLLKEIEGLDTKQLTIRVLVPKQKGLEDSSRYWSAAMVFEHLMIVGGKTRDGIIMLSKGLVPPVKADTAKVKPLGERDAAETLEAYKKFASTVMADIDAGVKDRDSKAVFAHPWMGPFTARQWHWILAVHQGVHLTQLRAIVKGLKGPQ